MKENILAALIGVMQGIGVLMVVWALIETLRYLL